MICNIQMWQGTIEVIVMPLTNGTRAGPEASVKAAIWGSRPRGAAREVSRARGKAGHALSPFRIAKWKSKRYNGVATSPRSPVSLLPYTPLVPSRFSAGSYAKYFSLLLHRNGKAEIVTRIQSKVFVVNGNGGEFCKNN